MATKPKTITIEDLSGGWIPLQNGGSDSVATSFAALEGAQNQYTESFGISLNRGQRAGQMAPGHLFTEITSDYFNAVPLNGDVASTGKSFMVLKNGRLVRTNTSGTSVEDAFTVSSTSTTSNPDMVIIKDAATTPNEYILWTYETSSAGGVAVIRSNGSDFNTSFMTLSGAVPLKMWQGPDGNVYILNGQYIASASMTSGQSLGSATKNTQSLNLGAGWIGSGGCSYKNYSAIIGYKATSYLAGVSRGQCRVWLWDGFSPDPNFVFDIPDNYASAMIFDGTRLLAYTNGRNGSSKVWQFTGVDFKLVFETSRIAASSTPKQGGAEVYQGSVLIGAAQSDDAASITYVRLYQFMENGSFHNPFVVTDGTIYPISVGMVKNLYTNQLFVGVEKSGSTYSVFYLSDATKYLPQAELRTQEITKWDDGTPIRKGKIRRHHFWFSDMGPSSKLTASLFRGRKPLNVGGASDYLNMTLVTTATSDYVLVSDYYIGIDQEIDDLSEFYMNFRFGQTAASQAFILKRYIGEGEETDVI